MTIDNARRKRRKGTLALAAVRGGELPLRTAIGNGYKGLESVPVWRVLVAYPGIGPKVCRMVLERSGVWPLLAMRDLTEIQRELILDNLPERVL